MIKLGPIAVFSFLTLLTGCYTKPCLIPGQLSEDPAVSCYHQIKITNVDVANYRVEGELPDVLIDKRTGERIKFEKSKELGNDGKFTFRVRNLEKVAGEMQVGKTYEFIRQGNSAYLELMP